MKKQTLNMRTLMNEIQNTSKLLKESYLLNESMPPQYQDEMNDDAMRQQHMQHNGMQEEMMDNDPHDENMDDEKTNAIVDKIRVLALKGIERFKMDVDNVYYDTFKKLFLMCDKALSDKEKDKA